jgi:hypothetical protein
MKSTPAPRRGKARRGQRNAGTLSSRTISMGLRYCTSISPLFFKRLGSNHPSWKFSFTPQNAQTQARTAEKEIAAQPRTWRRIVSPRFSGAEDNIRESSSQ